MKTVCVIVGHSSKRQGAVNKETELTEWRYNYGLAHLLMGWALEELDEMDMRIIHRGSEDSGSYELMEMISVINGHDPKIIISLHTNAFDETRQGHTVLHYKGSVGGEAMAKIFMAKINTALGNTDRAIRATDNIAILSQTRAPAVILEPFYIDNDIDCDLAVQKKRVLAYELYRGIKEILDTGI